MWRRFALLLAMLLLTTGAEKSMAEEETEQAEQAVVFEVTAAYGQTEARKQLAMVNEFRTGKDAWYWNEDNETKTVFNTSGEDRLTALEYDYELEKAAMQRAMEIVLYFEHERPVGGYAWDLYEHVWAGENIGVGYQMYETSEDVFQGWREDDEDYSGQDHRRNMLDPDITAMAAAYVHFEGYHFWVQLFRSPTGTLAETSAIDEERTVSVEVLPSFITDFEVSASDGKLELLHGVSRSLPQVSMGLRLTQTWPEEKLYEVSAPYTWHIDDSAVAEIAGGRIRGLQPGDTSLLATVDTMGKTLAIPVKVELFPAEIFEDEPGEILVPDWRKEN